MKRSAFRLGLLGSAFAIPLLAFLVITVAWPSAAAAHPLGNFTINRYSRLELYSDAIRVRYVLDMAEIPTFQEMDAIDRDGDGRVSDAEKGRYSDQKADDVLRGLHLAINGSSVGLEVLSRDLTFPEGQGGLSTLRLGLLLSAPVSGSELSVSYRDDNYADRIGWKEIVVRPADGVNLMESSAPAADVSNELRTYPQDLLSSPLDVRQASFKFVAGTGSAAPAATASAAEPALATAAKRPGAAFASLIAAGDLSLSVLLVSLLAALGFGALHALEPGHGKTLVAAYFVGVKGTARQAISLGLVIAVTHTVGVLLIGLVVLYASNFILPDRLYPWLSFASALLVLGLGLRLLIGRLRQYHIWPRTAGAPMHAHDHPHHHEAQQKVLSEDGSALPWKGLFALGLADGLTPSPSALVVLLAAISLQRIGLGLLLIVAFSAGLAAVLTVVSLVLVYARRLLDWLGSRSGPLRGPGLAGRLLAAFTSDGQLLRLLPLGGALVLVGVGLILALRALSQPGILGV